MLLQNQLVQTQSEIGSRIYDTEAHQKLRIEIAAIGESLNQKNQGIRESGAIAEEVEK